MSDWQTQIKQLLKPSPLADFLLIVGTGGIFFLFCLLLLNTVGFFLGQSVWVGNLYLSLIATGLVLVGLIAFRFKTKALWLAPLAIFLLGASFAVSWWVSSQFFDISYDGQAYHQTAVVKLLEGWNPTRQQLTSEETNNLHRWLNHYPKASWIWSASLVKLTGNLEQAKPFDFWLMFLAFAFVLSLCLRFKTLPLWAALVISLLAALNPVSLYQSLSFYLDGQLVAILTILLSLLISFLILPRRLTLVGLFLAVVIIANLKLTTIIFVAVLIVPFANFLFWQQRWKDLLKLVLTILIAAVVGWGVIGFNPYVTNTIYQGHPLYPGAGKGAIKFDEANVPGNWLKKTSVERLALSVFAQSANLRGKDTKAQLKLPFTWTDEELKTFGATNSKEGGWGPLFSASLILTLLVVIVAWASKTPPGQIMAAGKLMFLLFLSAAIFPLASVARYVPQIWLIPILGLWLAFISKNIFSRLTGLILAVVLGLNLFLIGSRYFSYNQTVANTWRERLGELVKKTQAEPLKVNFGQFEASGRYRFTEWGINFIAVSKEDCRQPKRLFPESIIESCL